MNSIKKGFTLVELLVVIAMVAILMAAMAVSVSGARERARKQKALSDVKVISQAILSYENYNDHELPTMNDQEATRSSLAFLIGEGEQSETGGKIPVLLEAALSSGGRMLDPWGTVYRIRIQQTSIAPNFKTANGNMQTGFYLPNFYRLSEGER